jgi:dihydrofolate reductase
MGNIIVYIAASLDGFIAGPDDDLSWLDPFSAGGEDYGYADFMRNVGTAVMGARTYEQSLVHPERLLTGLKNYVVTRRSLQPAADVDLELWQGSLTGLVAKIRRESKKDIFVVGGGQLVSGFLSEGLVDEIRLFVVPVILGEGVPLFTGLRRAISLELIEAVPYGTGIVKLRYRPAPVHE